MITIRAEDSEPDSQLVFVDGHGDYWWCHNGAWVFSDDVEAIGGGGYKSFTREWPEIEYAFGPQFTLTQVGWLMDRNGEPVYITGEKPADGSTYTIVRNATEQAWRLQDSGARTEYPGGGVRDSSEGKPRFDLLWPVGVPYDAQFLTRVAQILELGARKYAERNWEAFHTPDALEHAKASLGRHYANYMSGATDEDHLALMACNLLFLATIQWKIDNNWAPPMKED